MKILFVSWYFPPSNTIAAVRLGKLARHLKDRGHALRIVTAKNPPYPQTLPPELDEDQVHRVRWRDINWLPEWIVGRLGGLVPRRNREGKEARGGNGAGMGPPATRSRQPERLSLYKRLAQFYRLAVNFPDKHVGWLPAARRRGIAVAKEWRPDGIFASGPPFTTLLAGYAISRATEVPLVVEFRDRWSEDPYFPPPPWRRRWNRWVEERIARHAVGITTVSEPWAARFRERFAKPVAVIYNGFDAEDFVGLSGKGGRGEKGLRIVYTGGIYPGYRDPSPLFKAIASSPRLRENVQLEFYGTQPELVTGIIEAHGLQENVGVFEGVTHAEALRLQCDADALLLMQWDNPMELGNIPGKFAEYLGARRPLVVLGYGEGVPATFVKQHAAGISSTNPEILAAELEAWLDTKERTGQIPGLSDQALAGFSRREQAAKLESFLSSVFERRQAEGQDDRAVGRVIQ